MYFIDALPMLFLTFLDQTTTTLQEIVKDFGVRLKTAID
jgi:hypothetical protein